MALAYGPRRGEQSSWAHAHAAHSAALQARLEWLPAALAMQLAAEAEPDQARWAQERDRLLDCIPDAPAAVLQVLRGVISPHVHDVPRQASNVLLARTKCKLG